jgi:hypothetical protein
VDLQTLEITLNYPMTPWQSDRVLLVFNGGKNLKYGFVPAAWSRGGAASSRDVLVEFLGGGRVQKNWIVDEVQKTRVIGAITDSDGSDRTELPVSLDQQKDSIGFAVVSGHVEKSSAAGESQTSPFQSAA